MGKIKVTEVLDLGDDVLLVRGKDGKQPLEARGWVSALTNHYDAPTDDDGHRPDDAEAREMTKAEKLDYCRSLLEAVAAPEPKKLDIKG